MLQNGIGNDILFERDYILIYKLLAELVVGTKDSHFSLKSYEKLGSYLLNEVNPITEIQYSHEQFQIIENYPGSLVVNFPSVFIKRTNTRKNENLESSGSQAVAADKYRINLPIKSHSSSNDDSYSSFSGETSSGL